MLCISDVAVHSNLQCAYRSNSCQVEWRKGCKLTGTRTLCNSNSTLQCLACACTHLLERTSSRSSAWRSSSRVLSFSCSLRWRSQAMSLYSSKHSKTQQHAAAGSRELEERTSGSQLSVAGSSCQRSEPTPGGSIFRGHAQPWSHRISLLRLVQLGNLSSPKKQKMAKNTRKEGGREREREVER